MEEQRQGLLDAFREAATVLGTAADMTPANENINRALGAFVRAVLDFPLDRVAEIEAVLQHEDVRALREPLLQKLTQAEFEMELFYARPGRLQSFPYHENYRVLVAEEIAAINLDHFNTDDAPDDALRGDIYFVGSGPLPLTAVECARQTGRSVICVERDAEAVALSRRVIEETGVAHLVSVIEGDGAALDYTGAGLVIVAALVDGKEKTIDAIRKTAPEAMIGVRSAEGLRTLLYREIDTNDIVRRGYRLCGQSGINNEVVNTTLFFAPVCGATQRNPAP